jgi:hypothetical protein
MQNTADDGVLFALKDLRREEFFRMDKELAAKRRADGPWNAGYDSVIWAVGRDLDEDRGTTQGLHHHGDGPHVKALRQAIGARHSDWHVPELCSPDWLGEATDGG